MIFYRPSLMKCLVNLTLRHAFTTLLIFQLLGCDGQDPNKSKDAGNSPVTESQSNSSSLSPPIDSKPLNTVESLVAPVALYPDPLLAEVLVASTYPLEIVQAARWLDTKPDLETLPTKDWDASVARLTAVPSVVGMMNDHLDWTTQLGNEFLEDPKVVMDAVQTLRKRAIDGGYLQDSDQLKVSSETVKTEEALPVDASGSELKATPAVLTREVVTIQPAKEDTLSVPSYNPEVVYSAPLSPPPATTAGYGTAYPTAPAAPAYYPVYTAPPAATTSSSNDFLTFGAGAVVGGLLTWGIMEWADDDDDYYHVGHSYGNTVCHHGNCWSGGGGGGYYNRENNVNISGNEINIDRSKTFKEKDLKRFKNRDRDRTNGWQPDPRHRRGQAYPAKAQKRLGKIQQPALPGNRLPNAKTMPANLRGFEGGSKGSKRLSTDDIQRQLKGKPSNDSLNNASKRDNKLSQAKRDSAFENLQSSGRDVDREKRRGASSAKRGQDGRAAVQPAKTPKINRTPKAKDSSPKKIKSNQASRTASSQRIEQQRRTQKTKPSAFESAKSPKQSPTFGKRGAQSRNRSQAGNAGKPNRQLGNKGGGQQRSQAKGGGGRKKR